MAGEEWVPDLGLEFLDRRVERSERDAEGVCGTREVQLLGDCDETSKQGDVHGEPFAGARESRPCFRVRESVLEAAAAAQEDGPPLMRDPHPVESARRVQDSRQTRHRQCVRIADTAADADMTEGVAMPDGADSPAPGDDLAWFTDVVREHSTALVRYFARRGPRQDAEDLAADVFATAWRRRADVPREAVLPWLYRTAGFTLANHRRKLVDLPVDEVPETGEARVREDPELSALFDAELRGALQSVGERDRRILLLHAWEGLDGAELAEVLGISRSGADAALSRARKRLREAWGERMSF